MNIGDLMGRLIPLAPDKPVVVELLDGYHERADLEVVGAREDETRIVIEVK